MTRHAVGDTAEKGGPVRADGMPVGKPFGPGNPPPQTGGRPRKVRELEAAILEAETPERVKAVVDAMRTLALEGSKASPAAAKVYFGVIGIKTEGKTDEDFADLLRDAPPEVKAWLAAKVN